MPLSTSRSARAGVDPPERRDAGVADRAAVGTEVGADGRDGARLVDEALDAPGLLAGPPAGAPSARRDSGGGSRGSGRSRDVHDAVVLERRVTVLFTVTGPVEVTAPAWTSPAWTSPALTSPASTAPMVIG